MLWIFLLSATAVLPIVSSLFQSQYLAMLSYHTEAATKREKNEVEIFLPLIIGKREDIRLFNSRFVSGILSLLSLSSRDHIYHHRLRSYPFPALIINAMMLGSPVRAEQLITCGRCVRKGIFMQIFSKYTSSKISLYRWHTRIRLSVFVCPLPRATIAINWRRATSLQARLPAE